MTATAPPAPPRTDDDPIVPDTATARTAADLARLSRRMTDALAYPYDPTTRLMLATLVSITAALADLFEERELATVNDLDEQIARAQKVTWRRRGNELRQIMRSTDPDASGLGASGARD